MQNEQIFKIFKLHSSLLELHGENQFKVRSYTNAVFNLEKLNQELEKLDMKELGDLPGVGKAIAEKIQELNTRGSFKQFDEFVAKTPLGIVDMLQVKGLGVKKVQVIWKELQIENIEDLLEACEENKIAQLKGFGEKIQENIKQALLYAKINADKQHYAEAELPAFDLAQYIKDSKLTDKVMPTGQIRRKLEVVDLVQVMVGYNGQPEAVFAILDQYALIEKDEQSTGLFTWRGFFKDNHLKVEIKIVPNEQFFSQVFIHSASENHLNYPLDNQQNLRKTALNQSFDSEQEIYKNLNLGYIEPELREGTFELELAKNNALPILIENRDIQGILHAHSTYSDGMHTLEEMALACKNAGYQYLGITDHSKAAFYANGLSEERVLAQHEEIDKLNRQLAPFRIFKGIEADILANGELDYGNDFLKHFEFVIASVHSGLNMNEEKATTRLIKAIENPHTTILGHLSGRILLKRKPYPLNYQKIIDACAQNKVVIEINANPHRLDLDWRWIYPALEKGILLSINPDAHSIEGIKDTYYGTCIARKGGLTKEQTINTQNHIGIASLFESKKI